MLLYAVALTFALAKGQEGPDVKVTYSNPGMATPQLVEELSRAAHVSLFAPKAFSRDILTLRLKDAPLKDVMAKIADMTAADWEKKGDGYELVRSRAKLQAEEQAEYAAQVAAFQKVIDAQKKKLAALEPWTEQTAKQIAMAINDSNKVPVGNGNFDYKAWQRLQALDARAPGGRAATRVVALLDAKDLAALPLDLKTVYSDQPTRMQRAMPSNVLSAFRNVVAEQNMWADVAGRLIGEPEGGLYSNAMWMRKRFEGQAGKLLLMISKSKIGGYLSVSIEVVATDRKGTVILRGNQNLNTSGMEDMGLQMPKAEPGEKPVPSTAIGDAMKSVFDQSAPSTSPKTLPKELVDILSNPEQHEPVALTTGDLFVKIAEDKNLNLIGDLPDESFPVGAFASAQKMTPSMLFKVIGTIGLDVHQGDGWLVLSPKAAASTRANRVDRAVLGTFIRSVVKKGRAGLDDLASYATTVDGEMYNTIGFMIVMMLTFNQDNSYFETKMLRLYGLLDTTQRQMLSRGAGLPLGNLSPAESDVINKMIFGPNADIQPTQTPRQAATQEDWESFYNGIRREPTEMFGNGIPTNSILRMADQSSRVLVSQPYQMANGARYAAQPMGPDEVAQHMYAKERPGIFPWIDSDTTWDQRKFSFATRRSLTFTFEFGNLGTMTKQLQDMVYEQGDSITLDQLPDDFKKDVQKRLEEIRKAYANMKPGQIGVPTQGGTTIPPPPRR